MLYYRVKPQYDGVVVRGGKSLIRNELYTPTEFKKLGINPACVTQVDVSRKKTYISFGARFEEGTNQRSNL